LDHVFEYFLVNVIGLPASRAEAPASILISFLHILGLYFKDGTVMFSCVFYQHLFQLSQHVWSLVRSEERPNTENPDVVDSIASILAEFHRVGFSSAPECPRQELTSFLVGLLESDEPALIRAIARCTAHGDEIANIRWPIICQHYTELNELGLDLIPALLDLSAVHPTYAYTWCFFCHLKEVCPSVVDPPLSEPFLLAAGGIFGDQALRVWYEPEIRISDHVISEVMCHTDDEDPTFGSKGDPFVGSYAPLGRFATEDDYMSFVD
jgi:hypothetical protein